MKLYGIMFRILISPFIFLMILTTSIFNSFLAWYLFIKFGGEFYTYKSKEEKKSIGDVYDFLKEKLDI